MTTSKEIDLVELFAAAVKAGASDIHISAGNPPLFRVHGKVKPVEGYDRLGSEDTKVLVYSMLFQDQVSRFEEKCELDFSYNIPGLTRFRVNVLKQKGNIEAVMRLIPAKIPAPAELRISDPVMALTKLPRGLILVTGPTGSGKSTTLASLINVINGERYEHILTVEDPIEYVHESKRCVVRQREVGSDSLSFTEALRHALRQDPDVILVGEMRDLETISLALTASETGHLVFATLHTQDAPQTVDRIVDVFPPHQQQQIRVQLGASLKAVICQQLLPRRDGRGRVAAREVMIVTHAIANLIREGKTHQLYSSIETGAQHGMCTLEAALAELVKAGFITEEEAYAKANNRESLRMKMNSLNVPNQGGNGSGMQQNKAKPAVFAR